MQVNIMFKWNPKDYAQNSAAQLGWARELLARLRFRGSESVLDIGCGDGKITALVAQSLPRGQVIGIDASPEMIEFARQSYPSTKCPNLHFILMDAARLDLEGPFDCAFSNATLHWIQDHQAMLRGLSPLMKQGGKLLLSGGGRGNAAKIVAVLDALMADRCWQSYFVGFRNPYFFLGPAQYRRWLSETGFLPQRVELVPKDMIHHSRDAFVGWIRTTWMPYTCQVPEDRRERFISGLAERYLATQPIDPEGCIHVHMVRLEVEACKAP
jgi:trans-aconitate 2-methyltransferase